MAEGPPYSSDEAVTDMIERYSITARQGEILGEILQGHSAKIAADNLQITIHAYRDHVRRLADRTGVSGGVREIVALLFKDCS